MKNASLNRLAWQKLKQNKVALSSLIFIALCVFMGAFAVVLSPDSSPMANEMHIELATKKPFTKVIFLEIQKEEQNTTPFLEGLLIKRIPIDKYTDIKNGISYFPYHSKIEKIHKGKYQTVNQNLLARNR